MTTMSGDSTSEYSPTAAIVSLTLALATLPISVYPIGVLIRENLSLQVRRTHSHHQEIVGHILVWVFIVVCHLTLIVHALLAANEQACEYTKQYNYPVYGEIIFIPNCIRSLLIVFVDPIEAILSPIYPVAMLRLYVQILPTARQKGLRRATKAFTFVLGGLSVCLFFFTCFRRARMWSDNPFVLTVGALAVAVHPRLFDAWFAVMVSCAVLSAGMCIKILPHLRPHSAVGSAFSKTSKTTSATAHLTVSSTSTPLPPSPSASPTSPPATPPPDPQRALLTISESNTDSSAAAARIRTCIRWLWACLILILTLVISNIAMVWAPSYVPQIAYTTVGWVSCHLISVALFVATRMIKMSVLTRRLVPQSVAGTLAQSEWNGRG